MQVACAGVSEIGGFERIRTDDKGKPLPPDLKTLDINLSGSLYSACDLDFSRNEHLPT